MNIKNLAYLLLDSDIDVSDQEVISQLLAITADILYERGNEALSSKLQNFVYQLGEFNE